MKKITLLVLCIISTLSSFAFTETKRNTGFTLSEEMQIKDKQFTVSGTCMASVTATISKIDPITGLVFTKTFTRTSTVPTGVGSSEISMNLACAIAESQARDAAVQAAMDYIDMISWIEDMP